MRVGWLRYLLPLVCLLAFFGCGKDEEAQQDNRTAVQVVKPGLATHRKRLKFPGVTSAAETSKLSFQSSGEILELRKDIGDTVRAGEYLGRVTSTAQRAQVGVAQAQLVSAQAQHRELLAGSRRQEIEAQRAVVKAAEASVSQAKANSKTTQSSLSLAQAERDRYRKVFEAEALSVQQMQQVEAQLAQAASQHAASQEMVRQAQQQLAQAKQQLSLQREGPRPEQVSASAAGVEAAAAQVTQSQSQLQFTELRAPYSGLISAKLAEVGDLASPGQAVYELSSQHRQEFIIQVPSLHINKLEEGMDCHLTFLQLGDEEVPARVSEIQPVNDTNSRNFQVKLTMKEWPLGRELSGVIGMSHFMLDEGVEAYSAPVSSLKKDETGEGYSVFAVSNGKATLTQVEMVTVQDEEAVFLADFPQGADVVISGQEYLRDGDEVRVVGAMDAQKLVSPNKVESDGGQGL